MTLTFDQALASSSPRIGIFFRLGIDPPFRLWLGFGDCRAGIDAEDGDGETYKGLGQLLNVPGFQQLINGAADRATFSLSGVSAEVARLSSVSQSEVKGASLKVGIGAFGPDWGLLGDPIWVKSFTVDYLSVTRDQSGDPSSATWTVSLAARSLLTGRRRPGQSYFTDADQQARYPGDRFCDRAAVYAADTVKAWPKFS